MTTTISSPIPSEQIRRIILPVRGDASYHHLNLTVAVLQSAPDITYQPTRPFVLESALWKDISWRLHGTPGEFRVITHPDATRKNRPRSTGCRRN